MQLTTPLLHIENDALVARAVSRVLRQNGYDVRSIPSCTDAREVVTQFRVGIFDIDLSDGNGVSLAEELSHRGVITHAVFFTASTDAELNLRARKTGPVVRKTQGVAALMQVLPNQLMPNTPAKASQDAGVPPGIDCHTG